MAGGSKQLFGHSAQPNIDRARGGILVVDVIIPSEVAGTSGAKRFGIFTRAGSVKTNGLTARLLIDWEKLPLVNVSGYTTDREQIAPDEMPYHPEKLEFVFSTEKPDPDEKDEDEEE